MSDDPKERRQRRGIYLLPSMLTVANLLCGYYAILSTMKGTLTDVDNAAKAIGFAILFDTLDGRVARASKVSSPFGRELDSLADVISFGVAPAFLSLAWGLKSLSPVSAGSPELVRQVYQLGWIVSFAFLICGAWRLARFNIYSLNPHPHDPLAHRYFIGLPIPAAAGLIAATVHAFKVPLETWPWALAWLGLVASLSALMVSPVRYPSFKNINLQRRHPSVVVVSLGILTWSIWVYSEYVLLALAVTYVFSGLTGRLVGTAKRHVFRRVG